MKLLDRIKKWLDPHGGEVEKAHFAYYTRHEEFLQSLDERQKTRLLQLDGAGLTEVLAVLEKRIYDLEQINHDKTI